MPNATRKEIRSAFRRLALIYHPDKQPDNKLAHVRFLQLQEAYELLMDEGRRKLYDHERWLSGNFKQIPQAFTADALISDLEQLQRHLATIDPHRMDLQLLNAYLHYQLTDEKIGILQVTAGSEKITQIQQLCLHAGSFLSAAQYKHLLVRLQILSSAIPANLEVLDREERQASWNLKLERKFPWVLLLLTLLICLAMYLYGQAK